MFAHRRVDFVSIDIEGGDAELLYAWNLETYRPAVICAETVTHDHGPKLGKSGETIVHLEEWGYRAFADTFHNTLFFDDAAYRAARLPPFDAVMTWSRRWATS